MFIRIIAIIIIIIIIIIITLWIIYCAHYVYAKFVEYNLKISHHHKVRKALLTANLPYMT
jgi:hypothetical protein